MISSFTRILIRNNLLFSTLLFISLGLILSGFAYRDYLANIKLAETRYIKTQKKELANKVTWFKQYVDNEKNLGQKLLRKALHKKVAEAHKIILALAERSQNPQNPKYLLETAREVLKPIRFLKERGYFFMFDLSGVNILLATGPEMKNANMLDIRNSSDQQIIRDMIAIAQNKGEGFYEYNWTNPGAMGTTYSKIAFVKFIPELQIVIGAGEYLTDYTNELQTHVLDTLKGVSAGTPQYFFAGTFDGTSLLGPATGKNMLHATDINGKEVVKELIRTAKTGGGFVSYTLPAVDKQYTTYPKLSYVKSIPEWDWYIGAGISLQDITLELNIQRSQMLDQFINQVITALLIVLLLSSTSYLLTKRIVTRIRINLGTIEDFFRKASTQRVTLSDNDVSYSEFQGVKEAANRMILSMEQANHLESVLFEINNHAQLSENLQELLKSIHQIMIRELQADNFFVALIDEERDVLNFEYCADETIEAYPKIEHISISDSKRISLLPIRHNKQIILSKNDIEELTAEGSLDVHGTLPETWLGIPLRLRGVPIGIMVIQDYHTPNAYDKSDIQLVAACSTQIARAIERKRFDELSKTAHDIFMNIPSGVIIYQLNKPDSLFLINANPAAEALIGFSLSQWKGDTMEEIRPFANIGQFKKQFISPLLEGKISVSGNFHHDRKNAMWIAHVHSFILPGDKICLIFEDITDKEKAKRATQRSEEFYRALFHESHSVIHLLDPETGRIVDTNKAAEEFYGYTRKELLTKKAHDLTTLTNEQTDSILIRIKNREISRLNTQHILANGQIRDIEIFSGPFEASGKTRLIAIIHDITDRLRGERELARAKETAEIANNAKDEFLANISHEVRTPLNGVMGMLQLIGNSPLGDEQESYVTTALQSSKNLLRVLNDVLDFSKIQAGKLEIFEAPFDLATMIDQCVGLFKLQTDEKKLIVNTHIHENVQKCYVGDEGRIRQILFNLLGNAIKFTPSGFITMDVYPLPSSDPDKTRLFFSIEDSGIGIPEDKIDLVFETFTQVDGSLSRMHQGTGLGLPIVKRLVNLMDGNIEVESEPDKGSTFSFCILVGKTDCTAIAPEKVLQDNHSPIVARILLTEDDRVNRIMAQRLLEKQGHKVTCAKTGLECLDLLRQKPFDLILMDIQMPIMNGLEATHEIRTSDEFVQIRAIPIIGLTAHAMHEDKKRALEAGMDDYLSKPFEMEQLLTTLHRVISK